jgi:hypothetical protein
VNAARVCRLGLLVPATLACAFLVDGALRLLPHDLFSFRAWEAMRIRGEDAPFLLNHRYHNDRTYGNLAAIGNLPASRQYRSVTFTTDSFGYPNPPGFARGGRAAAITFGSSFSAGSELGDGATLAAQLGRMTGRHIYNAGGATPDFTEIRAVARRVAEPGALIIVEHPGTRELPPITSLRVTHKTARCRELLASRGLGPVCAVGGWLDRHTRVSPLEILAQKALKVLEDDRWLPNPYAGIVLRERLRNGEDMLFLAAERNSSQEVRAEGATVKYFRWLAGKLELERQGWTLLVVLVPEKYLVYAPLLRDRDPGAVPDEAVAYLSRVERGLRAAGVSVVNLTIPLRGAAATALDGGEHVYFLDDTHWNAAGAAVGAGEIRRAWDGLRPGR